MKGFRTSCSFSSPELSLSQGSSTAKAPFAGPKASAALSRPATPTASPSRTAASSQPTTPASRSAGRTIASTAATGSKTMTLDPARVHPALSPARAAQRLPPHPPLRALRQRQPRRQHRDRPRTARRRPACRRPATAAGCHTGRAACAAQPMPALRRPHDRHRGVRTRLRAEVAADTGQVRYVMSQTFSEPPLSRSLALAPRWRRSLSAQPRQSPTRPPVDTLYANTEIPVARLQAPLRTLSSSPGASLAPTIITGATIKSP